MVDRRKGEEEAAGGDKTVGCGLVVGEVAGFGALQGAQRRVVEEEQRAGAAANHVVLPICVGARERAGVQREELERRGGVFVLFE